MLVETVNKIRDILRSEGITGKDSINHCVCFVVCRFLNEDKCKKLGIPIEFSYESMSKDKDDPSKVVLEQDLMERFYTVGTKFCLMYYIVTVLGMKFMKSFAVKSPIYLWNIWRMLGPLDISALSERYDIIGTIYELHLRTGSSGSGMRDLGQYFTNRKVIEYMIKMCDPKIIDGRMETICDPSMGTGGFLSMSVKHLQEKYKEIDWNEQQNRIFGYDISEDTKSLAALNLFLETDVWFPHILTRDTLYNDMVAKDGTIIPKVDIILANEPMGLKNIVHASCCERVKDLKIRGTKAEPLFLQLMMLTLVEGGRCAVVVPDGLLFNDSNLHSGTREMLIEKYNIKKVVALNGDFFLNTGVKTSVIYFENTGRTTEVEFSELKFDDNEELIETSILKVGIDELVDKKYSLFVNKYKESTQVKYEGVKYMKLGDICQLQNGYAFKKNDFSPTGTRVVKITNIKDGNIIFKDDDDRVEKIEGREHFLIKKGDIMVAMTGSVGKIGIYSGSEEVLLNQRVGRFYDIKINPKYLFHTLRKQENIIKDLSTTFTLGNVSASAILEIEIPVPPLAVQAEIVERLDALSIGNENLARTIEDHKRFMKYTVDTKTMHGRRIKLGDICKFVPKVNKFKASDGNPEGKYRFYVSSQVKVLYRDDYEFEDYHLIIGRGGKDSIHYDKQFSVSHDDVYVITSKSVGEDQLRYVYWYLNSTRDALADGFRGATIKHLSQTYLNEIDIPIIPSEYQQKLIDKCSSLQNFIDQCENNLEKNKELMSEILQNYLSQDSFEYDDSFENMSVSASASSSKSSAPRASRSTGPSRSTKEPCPGCNKEFTVSTLKKNGGTCARCKSTGKSVVKVSNVTSASSSQTSSAESLQSSPRSITQTSGTGSPSFSLDDGQSFQDTDGINIISDDQPIIQQTTQPIIQQTKQPIIQQNTRQGSNDGTVINPKTNKKIMIGKGVYNSLIKEGYVLINGSLVLNSE